MKRNFCEACGGSNLILLDDVQKCQACGAKYTVMPVTQSHPLITRDPDRKDVPQYYERANKLSDGKKTLIIVVVLLLLALLIFGIRSCEAGGYYGDTPLPPAPPVLTPPPPPISP